MNDEDCVVELLVQLVKNQIQLKTARIFLAKSPSSQRKPNYLFLRPRLKDFLGVLCGSLRSAYFWLRETPF
jgi:hypothetical protein